MEYLESFIHNVGGQLELILTWKQSQFSAEAQIGLVRLALLLEIENQELLYRSLTAQLNKQTDKQKVARMKVT